MSVLYQLSWLPDIEFVKFLKTLPLRSYHPSRHEVFGISIIISVTKQSIYVKSSSVFKKDIMIFFAFDDGNYSILGKNSRDAISDFDGRFRSYLSEEFCDKCGLYNPTNGPFRTCEFEHKLCKECYFTTGCDVCRFVGNNTMK